MNKDKYDSLPSDFLRYLYIEHDLYFTPAGIWEWECDQTCSKRAVDAARVDNLDWADYPNDNLAKIRLPSHIVVLDIDQARTHIEDDHIDIPALDLTLPIGLYTQTSSEGKYHIYYTVTDEQRQQIGARMIKGLHDLKIDILQNFNTFEWHSGSPYNQLHEGAIPPLPPQLVTSIAEYIADKELSIELSTGIVPSSNRARAYLVTQVLEGALTEDDRQQYNAFMRSVIPKEYIPKNKKALKWDMFELSYDFINKIAVKLTATKELGFYEHTLPMLEYILNKYNIDINSKKSQHRLRQILPSLPQHPPLQPYHWADDMRELEDLIRNQPSRHAVIKTQYNRKRHFILIDKLTLEPLQLGEDIFFDQTVAEDVAPEYRVINEDGTRGRFDHSDIPIMLNHSDAFGTPYHYDDRTGFYSINMSVPSTYIKNAEPRSYTDNFLIRVVQSTVHPDYLHLYLKWMATVVFHDAPPLMIPWMATNENIEGGTGKSMVTITILDKILDRQVTTAKIKDVKDGWDITDGLRLISYEEGDSNSKQAWLQFHNFIKQSTSSNKSIANGKYKTISNKLNRVAQSGSSNSIPPIPESDRRILCLEPAHLEGHTQPLSPSDIKLAMEFEANYLNFESELQEFTNYLRYIYEQPIDKETQAALFSRAPATIYRDTWVTETTTNTKAAYLLLSSPDEFWALIHWERADPAFYNAMQYLIHQYSDKNNKVALCWEWFSTMLRYIKRVEDENEMTKRDVIRALAGPTFKITSGWGAELHKQWVVSTGSNWHRQLEIIPMHEEAINRYIELLNERLNAADSIQID